MQPVISEAALLQLAHPKFRLTMLLAPADSQASAAQAADFGAAGVPNATLEAAANAAGAFNRLQAAMTSSEPSHQPNGSASTNQQPSTCDGSVASASDNKSSSRDDASSSYGPWRPFMAPILSNERITSPTHFQDVRHIVFDLKASGFTYEPGDLLAIFPETPATAVDAFLERLGLDGRSLVRVEANEDEEMGGAHCTEASIPGATIPALDARGPGLHKSNGELPPPGVGSQGPGNGDNGIGLGISPGGPSGQSGKGFITTVRALVQGVVDIAGASPRRYFFQVLHNFAREEQERERLAYFATAEGREDLYRCGGMLCLRCFVMAFVLLLCGGACAMR